MSRNIIAILRGVRPDEVVAIAATIIEAGIERIEVPLNSPDPFNSIKRVADAFGEQALIGAGTVLTADDVRHVHGVGGRLIVSPDCNPEIIAVTKSLGLQSFPGVLTPTEAFAALRAGADGLKIFPGNVLQPDGLKALRAVLPSAVEVYAVGGVEPANFAAWRTAGANGFGIGSGLYQAGMSCAEVRARAADIVTAFDTLEA